MGAKSKIEWTDATWNPVRGCSMAKGSESGGCLNCYAARQASRFSGTGSPFEGFARIMDSGPRWTGKVELVEKHLLDPLKWRDSKRIFVNSMSDLFHEKLAFRHIARVIRVMMEAPHHTYQVLTKRAERLYEFAKWWTMQTVDPLPSCLWIGVSVEDQKTADERIPWLLKTQAAVRFVSYEPALGPANFLPYIGSATIHCEKCGFHETQRDALPLGKDWLCLRCRKKAVEGPAVDWIIVGGESGPGARPFRIEWARSVIAQCRKAEVACFVKQLGAKPYCRGSDGSRIMLDLNDSKGADWSEWPEDLRVREFPQETAVQTGAHS